MKRILLLAIISLFSFSAIAQSPTGREPKTIVADVLARMPAQNVAVYNQMMDDLIASGEAGILQLTGMIAAPGKGDNTAVSFALGGLAYYATTPGKEPARAMVTSSLTKALENATDREIKAFLIRMIQITAKDDAIPTLKKYALSSDLYFEAIHALAYINTKNSINAIIEVAPKVADKSVVAQVAGERKIKALQPLMVEWFSINDTKLHKAVTHALAELPSVEGVELLAKDAATCNYGYNDFESTGAFTKALAGVPYQNSKKHVSAISKPGIDASVRKQAMAITIKNNPSKSTKAVVAALSDKDRKYRNDVLSLSYLFNKKAVVAAIAPKFAKLSDDAKSDVINWYKLEKVEATDLIAPYVYAQDGELRKAAMRYLIAAGTPKSINAVIKALGSDNTEVLADASQALLWCKSLDFSGENMEIVNGATKNGKLAILNLLSKRNISALMPIVVSNIVSSDKELQQAAYKALVVTSKPSDIAMLYEFLDKASDSNVGYVQQALGEKLKMLKKEDALKSIETNITKGIKERKYALYAYVPTKEAVNILNNAAKTESGDVKKAAIEALITWPNTDALDVIYEIICDKSQAAVNADAVKSSLKLIAASKMTDAQKFIMLRRIMDVTTATEQQTQILSAMGRLNSLNALLYVAPYMNNSNTAQSAAFAAMNIALKDAKYERYGKNIEDILNKFIAIRTGSEAGYEIQSVKDYIDKAPKGEIGFVSIFNGKDLSGWKGLVKNPIARAKMSEKELATAQIEADKEMNGGWKADNGVLVFTGKGNNLCTEKKYGDFEMYVDWKIEKDGDAGIYLRGTPQVQIWDTCRRDVGAEVGSGGLYNNTTNISKPLVVADNKIGEWNTFYIKMVGERVTVLLNGQKVVDNVIMENYWNRKLPIFLEEQLELQAHGTTIYYRDILVKELPRVEPLKLSAEEAKEGFSYLFDGVSMSQWTGNTKDYVAENGSINLDPKNGGGGNLYTKKEYENFVLRFEFKLTDAANNGLGIRTPLEGDAAYVGMELQILDNEHKVYKDLKPYQYHGSVYGVIPSKRGFLKPVGEWNCQEVIANGDQITVKLNGETILDGNIREASRGGSKTADGKQHPGLLNKSGHIAFLGHGAVVSFKNIRIKELPASKKK